MELHSTPSVETLFHDNLGLVDRIVGQVSRSAYLSQDEAEDFAAAVKLALIEDDYARLRRWEGRASLAGYLYGVVRHLLVDRHHREFGRWRPSSEAARLGETGMLLEKLLIRDGHTVDEALPILRAHDPSVTHDTATAMAGRFRIRIRRRAPVALDDSHEGFLAGCECADDRVLAAEVQCLSRRASEIVRRTMARWADGDVLLIQFRFGAAMSVAEIARTLCLPQRPLYRRIESLLRVLRDALVAAGLDAATLSGVIGDARQEMDFGLEVA